MRAGVERTERSRVALRNLLAATLLVAGCTTSVTLQDVKSPVEERRTRLRARAPLLSARWQVEPRSITGEVTWTRCQNDRRWTTARVRTTRHEPSETFGWLLVAFGGGASVSSALMRDYDPKWVCQGAFQTDCHFEYPDNTGANVLLVTSLAASVGGIIVVASKARVVEKRFGEQEHHVVATEACVPKRDLDELVLVLKVGRDYWPVRLDPEGRAEVLIPPGVEVPRDVELELVVYRAPSAAAQLPMKKGQVLDSLSLEADEPAPPLE